MNVGAAAPGMRLLGIDVHDFRIQMGSDDISLLGVADSDAAKE
jgi:hypothetical protein